ncbi:MAG: flagellar export chaperone FlgN [Planctomycetales bacterium]|nr:flagellar export chaperone FlgN [Planctomycetales bacterium]
MSENTHATDPVLEDAKPIDWETEIANLLSMLSTTQGDLLEILEEKRQLLLAADTDGLAAIASREEEIAVRLNTCHSLRGELLQAAAQQGLPSTSIQTLAAALPREIDHKLRPSLRQAKQRTRLLQHQSLTNWVLVQRTVLHLSQILELIATGGRPQPTYNRGANQGASGALLDQAI